ncbi:hypothetical protein AGMMS49965_26120 [Bacteroidia bacterium]|nr:hypothetical protein AGMMS49965_26120 [Bacteroidia bacterium]
MSRCQIYDFSRISINDIVDNLTYIAKSEQVACEPEALNAIAHFFYIYLPRVGVVVVLPLRVSELLRGDALAFSRGELLLRVVVVVVVAVAGVVPAPEDERVDVVVLLLRGEVDVGGVVVYLPELRPDVVVEVVALSRGAAAGRAEWLSVRAGCGLLDFRLIADRSRAG